MLLAQPAQAFDDGVAAVFAGPHEGREATIGLRRTQRGGGKLC